MQDLKKELLAAAEGGSADAQLNLGVMLKNRVDDNGYAIEGNKPQAVRWLLAAAEQGLSRAQVKLAEVYADAPDISGSHATACGWFLVAATTIWRLPGLIDLRAPSITIARRGDTR